MSDVASQFPKTYPAPVEVTGWIRVVEADSRVTGEWVGGDVAAMSYELLEGGDPRYLQREGDIVTLCGHRMRIIADSPELETIYLRRVMPEMAL